MHLKMAANFSRAQYVNEQSIFQPNNQLFLLPAFMKAMQDVKNIGLGLCYILKSKEALQLRPC